VYLLGNSTNNIQVSDKNSVLEECNLAFECVVWRDITSFIEFCAVKEKKKRKEGKKLKKKENVYTT
jgi:hypothetical protein